MKLLRYINLSIIIIIRLRQLGLQLGSGFWLGLGSINLTLTGQQLRNMTTCSDKAALLISDVACRISHVPFSVLTLLIGRQEAGCWFVGGDSLRLQLSPPPQSSLAPVKSRK